MKIKTSFFFFFIIGASAGANANSANVADSYNQKAISLEHIYKDCYNDKKGYSTCSRSVSAQYDLLIKDIRKKYSANIDSKLWNALALQHAKQLNSCSSNLTSFLGYKEFYPVYNECEHSSMQIFFQTTLKLHFPSS